VPVNWAVINGETETGATLHYMTAKPDAGDIVDQQAVPILPDDTAHDVFGKVADAAAVVLNRNVPALVAGTAPREPQDLAAGSYFGGRKPEDGRIDWRHSAAQIHNLVRGVAPPYPGAFTTLAGKTLKILRTRLAADKRKNPAPALYVEDCACYAACTDGARLQLIDMEYDGTPFTAAQFLARFGDQPVAIETT
jgi:methionyl-tRNA formyltransferase